MNRTQTIIASIVEIIVIFAIPFLHRHGFDISEVDLTDALIGFASFVAFCFTNWYNHNYTDEAIESQIVKNENRLYAEELFFDEFDLEEGDE